MSEAGPLVSILINNYNYGRFLRDAIDSALNQTYPHTEVIVVDDGSTDDSREIIASYGRRIIPVLKENGGQASAFNAGFAMSTGEIICLLDSDDLWLPTKIELVVRAALADPRAVLIYHRVQPVAMNSQPVGGPIPVRTLQGDVAARVKKSGGWWASAPTSGMCLRRRTAEQVGPVPEDEFRICADAFLSYLLPLIGPVAGLETPLALYRLHGANNYNISPAVRRSRSAASLLPHIARYERYVAAVNQRLQALGTYEMLDVNDHWNYQYLKYLAGSPERLPMSKLAWRALRLPGEPSRLRRLRMAAGALRSRCLCGYGTQEAAIHPAGSTARNKTVR
jgi:glycosyltransferase involved in cell wall biosynthesis